MRQMFSNATVWWDQSELEERDALVRLCVSTVSEAWSGANRAFRMRRVETPILTPSDQLQGHQSVGFNMIETKRGLLRPETTAGCIAAFNSMFPTPAQRAKQLPYCVYQFGKSFRDESNSETMRASKLRLIEFHQLEFELFASADTKADYTKIALDALVARFGGESVSCLEDLPHYSRRTTDWMFGELEVAGCSERTDWNEGIIYEVSIGIDRLLSILRSQ